MQYPCLPDSSLRLQMRFDTPMSSPQAQAIEKLSTREQLRTGFKEMGRTSWSSARNFGKGGLLYSGIECGIEGVCHQVLMIHFIVHR